MWRNKLRVFSNKVSLVNLPKSVLIEYAASEYILDLELEKTMSPKNVKM